MDRENLGHRGAAVRLALALTLAAGATVGAASPVSAHLPGDDPPAYIPAGDEPTATPSRIVINPTETPQTSQAVTWRTDAATTEGVVEVEPAAGGALRTVESTPGAPVSFAGWTYESLHHSAVITGLTPDTAYRYRVGTEGNWSPWLTFRTKKTTGTDRWEFLYLGDAQNNLAEKWAPVVRRAFGETPTADLALHAGDLINTSSLDNEWSQWFDSQEYKVATVDSIATPGNHEVSGDPTMIQFREHFTNPLNGPASQEEVAYYTDFQGVRFISLNSNSANPVEYIEMIGFLTDALANNPNKWSVVYFHHPVYSASEGRSNPHIRAAFGPIIERHDVDLVLQGHDHSYARGHVTTNETGPGTSDGPVYVVSVSGPKYYELESPESNDWTRNGATRVVAHAHTSLFQQIQIDGDKLRYRSVIAAKDGESTASGDPGDSLDSFTITKLADGSKQVTEGARFPSTTEALSAPVEADEPSQVAVSVSSLPMPSGPVEVAKNATVLATGTATAGAATLTVPAGTLAPGTHPVEVRYLGSDEVGPSAATLDLVVAAPATPGLSDQPAAPGPSANTATPGTTRKPATPGPAKKCKRFKKKKGEGKAAAKCIKEKKRRRG